MAVVDAKLAASQLKKDYELLAQNGAVGNSPLAFLFKMIDKMPLSLEKEKKELRAPKSSPPKHLGSQSLRSISCLL
jgi:hypothetical protein